jgi:phosphatidylglycerol---prolipoprotein diacylglyceryl transferase
MVPRFLDWLPALLPLSRWTPYELALVLSFSFGLAWLLRWASSQRYPIPRVLFVSLFTMLTALLAARWLPWLLSGRPPFSSPRDLPLFAYGGFVGGALALVAGARFARVPSSAFMDAAAPVAAVGLALARVGCFLTGCDYGGPCDISAVAVRYPAWSVPVQQQLSAPAHVDHVARTWIAEASVASLPIHPVQLYESLLGLCLFIGLLFVDPARPWRRALTLAGGYALGRFLLEFLRGDADRGLGVWGTGLTSSQVVSLGVALAITVLYVAPSRPRLQQP